MRFGLHIVTVGQRYHTARFDAHRACRGLRYDHAVIAQTYRIGRTIHPTGAHRLQRDHLAELAAFTVGHGNQLNAFAPRIAGQITRFNAHVHARRDVTIRSDFLPHRISVIIVRDHHQIVLIHVLILFRAQCGNGVVDRKSAHNQRGAAGHAADRHDQTRFETENVARRDFAEEAHAIPQRLDTLQ